MIILELLSSSLLIMHRQESFFHISKINYRHLQMAIFCIALLARIVPGPRTIDDSYITYRYARNILAGNGFVYNPGEQVLGTTTPLYTILLAGAGAFIGGVEAPFPQIALYFNALADGITCLLLLYLGKKLGSSLAGLGAALVWAIAPFSVTFAIGGLETSIYVLLLTSTISAHISERHTLASFLGALAFLTRPDALILLGPLILDRLWQLWSMRSQFTIIQIIRSALGEILAFVIPTMMWLTFATIYFGNPLPHSIAAKSLAYRLPQYTALTRLLQHYATPFLGHLTFGILWIGIGLIIFPFLFLVGARHALRINRHIWPFLVYPWIYFLVFAIANPLIFRWYLTPPLTAYILTIFIGLEGLLYTIVLKIRSITQASTTTAIPSLYKYSFVVVVIFIPLLLTIRGWTLKPDHGYNRPAPEMAWYNLELLYRQAAKSLAPEIGEASTDTESAASFHLPVLAAGDVGVLGYFTQARILDTVGLNSPQTLNYYPLEPELYAISYAISPDLIIEHQPDYLVILEVYGRHGLLKDPRFKQQYKLRQKIPTDIYGSDGMLIFERKNSVNPN
jgi:hypothetical protein